MIVFLKGQAISDIEIDHIVQSVITNNSDLDFPGLGMNTIHSL